MRNTKAEIHLKNLVHNVNALSQNVQDDTLFCGVVKADGYGHGAIKVADQLVEKGVNHLAVAIAEEALELRNANITVPLLVLTPVETDYLESLIKNQVKLTVFTEEQARLVKQIAEELETTAIVHLKVDSGMSRIGVNDSFDAVKVLRTLDSSYVNVEGIYTHFADADNMTDDSFTHQQFEAFEKILNELEAKRYTFEIKHCCNTAATVRFPEYHLDMVRVGIGLYGYLPDETMKGLVDLKPVMTIKSEIANLKTIHPGRKVGYGCTYEAIEGTSVATIVIGYADGVLRSLSNTGYFVLHNTKVPIIGRVCMDQLMLDVSNVPNAKIHDEVIWFGNEVDKINSLFDICNASGSFHYEMLTRISKRVPRVYLH